MGDKVVFRAGYGGIEWADRVCPIVALVIGLIAKIYRVPTMKSKAFVEGQ